MFPQLLQNVANDWVQRKNESHRVSSYLRRPILSVTVCPQRMVYILHPRFMFSADGLRISEPIGISGVSRIPSLIDDETPHGHQKETYLIREWDVFMKEAGHIMDFGFPWFAHQMSSMMNGS